jgi:hypothetical protein
MTAEHFTEILYTIMFTTKSSKKDICWYLDVSRTSLEKWLQNGLPTARGFLILDKLEVYLFERLAG